MTTLLLHATCKGFIKYAFLSGTVFLFSHTFKNAGNSTKHSRCFLNSIIIYAKTISKTCKDDMSELVSKLCTLTFLVGLHAVTMRLTQYEIL